MAKMGGRTGLYTRRRSKRRQSNPMAKIRNKSMEIASSWPEDRASKLRLQILPKLPISITNCGKKYPFETGETSE
jgi:hypothetical protein